MIIIPSGLASAEALAGRELALARVAYENVLRDLTDSDLTVSGATTDGPSDGPLSPDTYTFWEPDALTATWEAEFASTEIAHVGIAAHTLGTSGCTVLVETSDGTFVGSPFSDLEEVWTQWSDEHTPDDDEAILFLDSPRTVTKVRFTITGGSALPRIAVFSAGGLLVMQTKIRGGGFTPLNLSRDTVMRRALSKGGQFLGQEIQRRGVTGNATFEHLEGDWVRDTLDPFILSARRYPFFFAWRPLEYPEEVAYVWVTSGDIRPQYEGIMDWMGASWEMQGIGND